MSSLNFAFVESHDPLLARYAEQAERYVYSDPNASLLKTRQFAELLAQRAAAYAGARMTGEDRFLDVLRFLRRSRTLPRKVEDDFHAIRKAGNLAAHDHEDDAGEALHQLKNARHLALWFHRAFGKDPRFRAGPFVTPTAAPDEAASRALESEIEELEATLALRLREAWAGVDPERAPLLVDAARRAAAELELDEVDARRRIDQRLREAGWRIPRADQTMEAGWLPTPGEARAIADVPALEGSIDYVLYDGETPVVALEASVGDLDAALDKARERSRFLPGGPRVPFVAATDGRAWDPDERSGGVRWLDARREGIAPRTIGGIHRPRALRELRATPVDAAEPACHGLPAHLADAGRAVEAAFREGKRSALVVLPLGTGRTTLTIALIEAAASARPNATLYALAPDAWTAARIEAALTASAPKAHVRTIDEVLEGSPGAMDHADLIVVDEAFGSVRGDEGLSAGERLTELRARFDARIVALTAGEAPGEARENLHAHLGAPVYVLRAAEAEDRGLLRPVRVHEVPERSEVVRALVDRFDPLLPGRALVFVPPGEAPEHARVLRAAIAARYGGLGASDVLTWTASTADVDRLLRRFRDGDRPRVLVTSVSIPHHVSLPALRTVVDAGGLVDDAARERERCRAGRPRGDHDTSVVSWWSVGEPAPPRASELPAEAASLLDVDLYRATLEQVRAARAALRATGQDYAARESSWSDAHGMWPCAHPIAWLTQPEGTSPASWSSQVGAVRSLAVASTSCPVERAWLERLCGVWSERFTLDEDVLRERRYASWWRPRASWLRERVQPRLLAATDKVRTGDVVRR